VPVVGVVPYVPRLRIADEDSVSLDARRRRGPVGPDDLEVAVVCLPRISNYDDVQALEHEPGVVVRFVERAEDIARADLVIVPGTKSTMADLAWLRESGLAAALTRRARREEPVIGICGGCEILGERIEDPDRVESTESAAEGLGLLPIRTHFGRSKTTARVVARSAGRGFFGGDISRSARFEGYEIHMGRIATTRSEVAAFEITERGGRRECTDDGAVDASGAVVGTMIHGLLEDNELRSTILRALRRRRGLTEPTSAAPMPTRDDEYNRLADAVGESLNADWLDQVLGHGARP
jgi:adenosylcobyric acid synthase